MSISASLMMIGCVPRDPMDSSIYSANFCRYTDSSHYDARDKSGVQGCDSVDMMCRWVEPGSAASPGSSVYPYYPLNPVDDDAAILGMSVGRVMIMIASVLIVAWALMTFAPWRR